MPRKVAKTTKKPALKHRITRSVKRAVVPHKANGYHPHAIRPGGLVILLAIVAALQFAPQPEQLLVLGQETDVTSQSLLDDTNTKRADANVAPLQINQQLSAAATSKARDMFNKQYWAHTSPDGTTPWNWIKGVDYKYSFAGENLAKGFRTSDTLITAWMNSPEHRDNMLSPNYEHVGFAVIEGQLNNETTKLVVAMYGEPLRTGSGATETVLAATGTTSPIARIGIGIQSMTPALLASIALLMGAVIISLAAHMYRHSLPKPVLNSWKRHHGLYKALSMSSLVIVIVVLYGGGQII
ncbi:MAG: CAP domain-containing protein [Patescibacteria group bacterium]